MVFVAGKHPLNLVQGPPAEDLRLQIIGSSHDGQIVRLAAAKCTIGSAVGCTLRLRAGGVRSVHCLILRGSTGTVARSWAPNTRLNGQPFRDAPLVPGDRLSIGPIELAVLPSADTDEEPPDNAYESELALSPAPRPAPPERSARLPAGRLRKRRRVQKLVAEVRKLRSQLDQFEAPTALPARQDDHSDSRDAELAARENELSAELARLESSRLAFDEQRQLWSDETEQARGDLAQQESSYRQAQ
jgi:hypothetical protein